MKNQRLIVLPVLCLLMLAYGCESMISDVEVPESDPKLVVTSFLSPADDTLSVSVYKSRPLYKPASSWDNSFPPVNNATVTISDGNKSVTLPYHPQSGIYKTAAAAMPVNPGTTYYLSVTTPEGFKAESSCTIPRDAVPEVEIVSVDTMMDYGTNTRKVSLRFRDLPGQGNYYRISAGTYYDFGYESYFSETGFERGEPFVSDKNKDGEYFTYRTWEIYQNNGEDFRLYVSLLLTDANYFNYHRSANESSDGDNPFAEPTPVYSNIRGGLGVFAGVNGKITVIDLTGAR